MCNCEQSFHGVQVGLSQDENCVAAGVVESPKVRLRKLTVWSENFPDRSALLRATPS